MIQDFHHQEFTQIIENLESIPASKLINYVQDQSDGLIELGNSLEILDYLNDYRKIVDNNFDIFTNFKRIIDNILSVLRIIHLTERQNQLKLELELANKYKKSSELSAIIDLINKLKETIASNRLKLNYIEEDYLKRKNQIDQINENLALNEKSIQELNQIKKSCFSQINKITRQIDGASTNQDIDSMSKLGIETNLTNSEKIRALQKKAKDSQYEINQIKSKSNQIKGELENFFPQYEIYKKDYEEILESIEEDENRIRTLQKEYKTEINRNKEFQIEDIKDMLETTVRPSFEIENEISTIDSELGAIVVSNGFSNGDYHDKLKDLIEKLREIDNIIRNNKRKNIIPKNEKTSFSIFEQFNIFENALKDLEGILNIFLKEINLNMKFLLFINDTNTSLFLKTDFIRNDKENVNFQDLTTPEKIFFIVSFFFAIGVFLKKVDIFFSNLFLPAIYNKGGSIYRTIRRLLPIFETNTQLKNHKIIFLISNLELKKEIDNIKIINVEKS
jgi:chromosome segregation ATPase